MAAKLTSDESLEKVYLTLKSHGIPTPKIKGKGTELRLIPLGPLNLTAFFERHPEFKTNLFETITFEGQERNTEFDVFYTLKKENQDDETDDEFLKIKKTCLQVISNAVEDLISGQMKTFSNFEERIPEKLRKNLKISDSFRDISGWKVKVVLGNSRGGDAPDIGEYDDVGYTMINVDTGEIVPIARSDEHHMGYDLMRHYYSKKILPKGRYYPIFHGQNYVYDEHPDEVSRALKAFKIWLDLGGNNGPVSSGGNRGIDYVVTMEDFIKSQGQIDLPKGELLPVGKRIVRCLERAAELIQALHLGKPIKEDKVCDLTELLLRDFESGYMYHQEVGALRAAAQAYRAGGPLKTLEQALFSHNGFKNMIHMDLKEAIKDPRGIKGRDSRKIFGDVEFAFRELNRLSLI